MSNMFFLKNDRNHRLETGWNDRLIEHRENKYLKSVDRAEILQLMSTAPSPASSEPLATSDSVFSAKPTTAASRKKRAEAPPATAPAAEGGGAGGGATTSSMYESITKAVGFKHHRGTDRNAELKVLKVILQRENKLIELQTECNKINRSAPVLRNADRTGILDLLSQIRELCVQILESVVAWRDTMASADPDAPRPFMWQRQNYVIKMVNDLNFLSYVEPLVVALKIGSEKMVKNPLMLPETLGGTNDTDEAFILAQEDAHGNDKGPVFLERLRLRIAEQVFLKELDFNKFGMPSIAWTEYSPSVASDDRSAGCGGSAGGDRENPVLAGQYNEERKLALLDWQEQANRQLKRILSAQGEQLRSASTQRLLIPSPTDDREEFAGVPKFSFYPTPGVVPSLLTELHLGEPEVDQPRSPIYLRGHFRNSPVMNEAVKSDRAASAKKGSKPPQPQTSSPGGYDSGEDSFGQFADNNNNGDNGSGSNTGNGNGNNGNGSGVRRKNKGVREIRGLPAARAPLSVGPVSPDVVSTLLSMGQVQPPTTVLRATGAVRILISSGEEIPEDLTWPRFLELAVRTDIADAMTSIDVNAIPKFKLRAVTPFLDQLRAPSDMDDVPEEVRISVAAMTAWIQRVLDASEDPAAFSDAQRAAVAFEALPDDGGGGSTSRGASRGKPTRPKRVSRDTAGGGPTELRLLAYRPPKPHDTNLAIVYSEMITHLFVRPVVLSLLVPSSEKDAGVLPPTSKDSNQDAFKKGLDKQLAKYIVAKVYDAATSHTSETILNLREYSKYQEELVQQYDDESVRELFQPDLVGWWIENLKNVSSVSLKPGGALVLRISKSMIGRRVARFLGVFMSQDSGDYLDTGESVDVTASHDSSGTSGLRGTGAKGKDLYGLQSKNKDASKKPDNKKTAAVKKPVARPPPAAKEVPAPIKVKTAPPSSAPAAKKQKSAAPRAVPTGAAACKPPAQASPKMAAIALSASPTAEPGIGGGSGQYGSAFSAHADKDSAADAAIADAAIADAAAAPAAAAPAAAAPAADAPVAAASPKKASQTSAKVVDPYAEPDGGFKIAKSERASLPVRQPAPAAHEGGSGQQEQGQREQEQEQGVSYSSAKSVGDKQMYIPETKGDKPVIVEEPAPAPAPAPASLGDTMQSQQSAVFDDEFVEFEAEEASPAPAPVSAPAPASTKAYVEAETPPVSEGAAPAPAPASVKALAAEAAQPEPDPVSAPTPAPAPASKEDSASYADDFDDAGYGDEFEDADSAGAGGSTKGTSAKKVETPKVSAKEAESAFEEAPVAVPAPASEKAAASEKVAASVKAASEKAPAAEEEAPPASAGHSYRDDFDPLPAAESCAEGSNFGDEEELQKQPSTKHVTSAAVADEEYGDEEFDD
jgi:hypothetical protein